MTPTLKCYKQKKGLRKSAIVIQNIDYVKQYFIKKTYIKKEIKRRKKKLFEDIKRNFEIFDFNRLK